MKKGLLLFTLLFAFCMQDAMAQTHTVKGRVLDENGEGAAGATVTIKGTTKGASTDVDGNYSIDVDGDNVILVIKAIGATNKEVKAVDGLETKLQSSSSTIGEVSIYGKKMDPRSTTGAVTVVGAAEIAKRPVTDIMKAIDGAAPGVQVSSGGGQPGQTPDVQMRGPGSINGNQSPLIVLDGAPFSGTLISINPLDVETMTFLKDATATALYGSRGANGVIVVTTKRGRNKEGGGATVSLDASVGILNRYLPEYKRVGAKDYYELAYRGYSAQSSSPNSAEFVSFLGGYNSFNVPNDQLMVKDAEGNMVVNPNASLVYNDDWQDELQRVGIRQNYNLSVSNGDGKNDYYLSIGYTKDQGIVRNSDYNRFTTRLNVNSQVKSWLRAGISLSGTLDDKRFFLSQDNAYTNPFFTTRMMGSIYPVYRYDSTGNRMFEADGTTPIYDFGVNDANNPAKVNQERPFATNTNVIGALFQDDRNTRALNGVGSAYIEAKFLKSFTFTTNFVINYYNGINDNFQNSKYGDASNVGGRLNRSLQTQYNYTFNQQLSWDPTFGIFNKEKDEHHLNVTAVHEAYLLRSEGVNFTRTGFPSSNYKEGAAAAVGTGSTSSLDYQTLESYLALFSYDYKRKYYLTGNVRRDGTSRFSPESRWGTFGAIGAGWVLSDEAFMFDGESKRFNWLDMLKLRGSYGITGQQDLGGGYYVWQSRYDFNPNNTSPGYTFTTWGNRDLKWEGKLKANIGFYLEMLQHRVNVNFDYFHEGSRNMLFAQPLASSTGVGSIPVNVGNMLNKGIEIQINADIVKTNDFTYNTRINLTHLKNKITKVENEDSIISGSFNLLATGKPYGGFYLPHYVGVNDQGIALYGKADGTSTTEYNTLTSDDYIYSGAPYRDIDGSWTNNFRYKNFDLSFMISFGLGGKFYDATYQQLMGTDISSLGQAMSTDLLNAWVPADKSSTPNVTDIPRISYTDRYANSTSDRFLISNSFASLKNINLGYTFTSEKLRKMGVTNLRLYAAADNVLYFASRTGVDLQQNLVGISSFSYYPYRTITFGLNLGL